MNETKQLNVHARHASPGGRPQPLAFHRDRLWVGCWDTEMVYAIDPASWKVEQEFAAPGKPFGLAGFGDGLRAVIALEDDNRYLFRISPTDGFILESKVACPDFTGSHLASDGSSLYLGQMHNRRIVTIDDHANILREFPLPTRCGGFAFGPNGRTYMISADDEFDNLVFGELHLNDGSQPSFAPIAPMDPNARSLAHDGRTWWTNYREENQTVSFTE